MNKFKQVYIETKLKLNSMSIILLIAGGLSFLFVMISMLIGYYPVPGILGSSSYYGMTICINMFSIMPIIISSIVIGILYNIKNNKKSYDNIGATNETYCISNIAGLMLITLLLSVSMMVFEVLIVLIAGTLPSMPTVNINNLDLLSAVGINLLWYICFSFMILKIITLIANNLMNRNYFRIIILIAIPVAICVILLLVVILAFDTNYIYGGGGDGLPEGHIIRVLYRFLSDEKTMFIAVAVGLLIADPVEYLLCVKRGRLR